MPRRKKEEIEEKEVSMDDILKSLKEIKKDLEEAKEKIDDNSKDEDERIFDERREELKKETSQLLDDTKRVFFAIGEGQMIASGTGADLLQLSFIALSNLIEKRHYPQCLVEDCFEQMIEQIYD